MYSEPQYIPQGWQCPVCKRVYSPEWPWCTVCGQGVTTTTTTELPINTFTEDAQKFVHDFMTGKTGGLTMDLISRKAAIETLALNTDYQTPEGIKNDLINHPGKECDWLGGIDEAISIIEELPSVPAVPLDKLCEWLVANASYVFCGSKNTWKFEARHWKDVLTKWMEEQDAD